ncbi:hypothetical protein, variant [Verruconis gallopava]|nr:hypothetical protein, variant [Verruconis gallopava]KIW04781.1 hypothetical protein, variant [Verruconis gallopava]
MAGASKEVDDFNLDRSGSGTPRQHKTSIASSRMTGRSAMPIQKPQTRGSIDIGLDGGPESNAASRPSSLQDVEGLAAQIAAWIQREKNRRAKRKARRKQKKKLDADHDVCIEDSESDSSSEGSQALDNLQDIISRSLAISDKPSSKRGLVAIPRKQSRAKLRRPSAASESEYGETEDLVPTCDVILDNSKTLSYSGGRADIETSSDARPPLSRSSSSYQKDAWKNFKYEIVRLTHTLRLKGWRRVPMQMSSQIEVIRLSGALTNAVYEVLPPKELPAKTTDTVDGTTSSHPKAKPQKLLLRIYGPGVDNLIDREAELQILRRLRRKNIGPRLLGCFSNGRFEEFFHAETLKPHHLRDPSISVQIAKRMRELHEGIDLLPLEREGGPFVWQCIEKWQEKCGQIVKWLDAQAKTHGVQGLSRPPFVCGTEWSVFIKTVKHYHEWLYGLYGGVDKIKEQLVFAHNDTQYGNILRMTPEGESPLLTPANQHKRLQVIDFEYANANLPGLEFADHFTEWCYNYHDEKASHVCNEKNYPTIEEQRRFLHAYVTHKPSFSKSGDSVSGHPSGPTTPALTPATSSLSTSLISNFMLDSRFPQTTKDGAGAASEEEVEREIENEVTRLQHETRLWRPACAVFWIMWGVMKAKIPDLPDFDDPTQSAAVAAGPYNPHVSISSSTPGTIQSPIEEEEGTDPLNAEARAMANDFHDRRPDIVEEGDEEDAEEFDYLGYSWERAMLFWGDAVGFGFVKREELPEDVQRNLKVVEN